MAPSPKLTSNAKILFMMQIEESGLPPPPDFVAVLFVCVYFYSRRLSTLKVCFCKLRWMILITAHFPGSFLANEIGSGRLQCQWGDGE